MPRVRFEEVRDRFKSVERRPDLIAMMVAEQVGVCDSKGNRVLREDGAPTLAKDAPHKPADFPFDLLAEAIIGRDWREHLGMNNTDKAFPFLKHVQEEGAAPIGPSVWANVAAWSATVGGLMQAQFNLGYNETPEFELADLFPVRPAVFFQGGERYIDIIGPFQPAQATGPGEEYPDNSMSALWVEPGAVKKYAGKILLTKEALSIDISGGQMLSAANNGGWTLKFRENEEAISLITGQTNNFKMGMLTDTAATGYNTYGPTITSPAGIARTLTNDIVNPLNDPLATFQQSDEQLSNLYHPVTDNPLVATMDVAIFPTPMARWAQWLMGMDQVSGLTVTQAGPAQGPNAAGFPTAMGTSKNPWQNMLRPIVSRWLDTRHVASTSQPDPNRTAGLGLTGAARYRWYRVNPQRFGCRRQKWAANSMAIAASDYVMVTQGIAAAFAWDIAFQAQVLSPYHIQRNKAA